MNRFDAYITDYLYENKEVALEKIGLIKITSISNQDVQTVSVEFTPDRKIATSPSLIEYISAKENKNKHLITSDLESYLAQVREFINIGKSYEILHTGFIKANKNGIYEFIPYSEANKPLKTGTQPAKQQSRNNNRSIIQLFTFLIVIAILAGLGWQGYQFFTQSKTNNASNTINNHIDTVANKNADTSTNMAIQDTAKNADSTAIAQQPAPNSTKDTLNVRYIFETTASGLRARTRTAQLKSFGNNAGYDSFVNNQATYYNLYIVIPTKISDTLSVKDSIARFFQKNIKLVIEPNNP